MKPKLTVAEWAYVVVIMGIVLAIILHARGNVIATRNLVPPAPNLVIWEQELPGHEGSIQMVTLPHDSKNSRVEASLTHGDSSGIRSLFVTGRQTIWGSHNLKFFWTCYYVDQTNKIASATLEVPADICLQGKDGRSRWYWLDIRADSE